MAPRKRRSPSLLAAVLPALLLLLLHGASLMPVAHGATPPSQHVQRASAGGANGAQHTAQQGSANAGAAAAAAAAGTITAAAAPSSSAATAARSPDRAHALPNWCSTGTYHGRNPGGDQPALPPFTTMTRTSPSHKVFHNAYWHAHKWYALVPPDDASSSSPILASTASSKSHLGSSPLEEGLSANTALIRLPASNISALAATLRTGYLPGTSLLLDFPFPAFPDHLGHWAEVTTALFSVLAEGRWRDNAAGGRGRFVDRIILPNLRKEMNDWFKEILAISVSPGVRPGGAPVPPIIDHADLEAFPKLSWLAIENLLVVQDRYTHPQRKTGFLGADHGDLWRYDGCARYANADQAAGFSDPRFAAEFRAAAYKRAGLPPPAPGWQPGSPPPPPLPGQPRLMTLLLTHEDYPPVINWEAVQSTLRRAGAAVGLTLRTVSLSTDAPFASHLDTLGRSSVLVARHGPLLASAPLMAPGSAVFELLPYKWEWLGMSRLYANLTRSTGDLHHFAWRPSSHLMAHYDHENYTRYHTWTPEECSARECLMVHARAGLTVDLQELEALLAAKLPGVVAGRAVEELREPWPRAV